MIAQALASLPEDTYRQSERTLERIRHARDYAGYTADMIGFRAGHREVARAIDRLQEAEMWLLLAQEGLKHEMQPTERLPSVP